MAGNWPEGHTSEVVRAPEALVVILNTSLQTHPIGFMTQAPLAAHTPNFGLVRRASDHVSWGLSGPRSRPSGHIGSASVWQGLRSQRQRRSMFLLPLLPGQTRKGKWGNPNSKMRQLRPSAWASEGGQNRMVGGSFLLTALHGQLLRGCV